MSPLILRCILCGVPIYDSPTLGPGSWLREFRASKYVASKSRRFELMESVYSCPSGVFVSGIGINDDDESSTWIAPSDSTMRWDDDDYLFPASDELRVMRQRPLNGRRSFVLHDACWHLLQRAFQPGEIPLMRLLEVCKSLPFPLLANAVCWGHDYGGLLVLDDQNHYPWEDRLVEHVYSAKTHSYAKENPYKVPELPALLLMRLEHPSEWLPKTQRHDCFSKASMGDSRGYSN